MENEPARFQLTSCNNETISTELTTNCHVDFKVIQRSVPSHHLFNLPHIVTPLVYKEHVCWYCQRSHSFLHDSFVGVILQRLFFCNVIFVISCVMNMLPIKYL